MAGIKWIQLDIHEHLHGVGRRIVGTKTAKEWADLGRYDVLKDLCALDERGYLDLSNPAEMRAIRDELRLSAKACGDLMDRLALAGAIDRDSWSEKSWVMIAESWNARQRYESKCRANRSNGKRGGRPAAQPQMLRVEGDKNPVGFGFAAAQQKPNHNPRGFSQSNPTGTQAETQP